MNIKIIASLIFLSQLYTFNIAQASYTNPSFDNNDTYTTDNISGLDWLDLTATTYMSHNQVTDFIQNNPTEQWRFATSLEVFEMQTNWNNGDLNDQQISGTYWNLIDTLGATQTNGDYYKRLSGFVATLDTEGSFSQQQLYHFYSFSEFTDDYTLLYSELTAYTNYPNYSTESGHYLVRDTLSSVPVPAAIWFMLTALLGLMRFTGNNTQVSK